MKFNVLLPLLGVFLIGCQTTQVEEAKVAKPLPPMERPAYWTVGGTFVSMKNGEEERRSEVISRDGALYTWKNNLGCQWTREDDLPFAAWSAWEGCNNPSGTNNIELIEDIKIFPLSVGKSWSYRQSGSNEEGRTWETIRKCEVEGEARITTRLGEFDTFKIVCADSWNDYTWYISPEYENTVKFIYHNRSRNSTNIFETVSYSKQ